MLQSSRTATLLSYKVNLFWLGFLALAQPVSYIHVDKIL